MSDTHPTNFFVVSGPLKGNAPSYIERHADEELYQTVKRGEFCCVLATRQMGKSSLIAHTAHRLQAEGVHTAIIDLTQIGTAVPDQWYFDFVSKVAAELDLDTDVETWWQANDIRDIAGRFTNFLRDVVLTKCSGNVVLFIDDIDFVLGLDFAGDFFAAIRAIYNSRSRDATFERLTFVLMGTGTPSDLANDRTRTPFNIGRRVALNDFRWRDVLALEPGIEAVYPQQGKAILLHIYRWTRGHPYLTQKICQAIVEAKGSYWSDEQTDQVVNDLFLGQEASKEENIAFVRHSVLNQGNRRNLLKTYRQVLRGKEVVDKERSAVINQLKLSGLVKTEDGYLQNRNEIYRQLFDEQWLKENMPINWPLMAAITFGLIAALLIIYFVAGLWQAGRAEDAALALLTTGTPTPTGTFISSDVTPVTPAATFTPITGNTAAPTETLNLADVTPTVFTPITTDTSVPISTLMPTETSGPTPIPTAVAIEPAIIFRAPDTRTRELARVQTDETVEVLGRSADRFGRVENKPGLYIRTSNGIEGFVVALFFQWPGIIEELPILQPKLAEVTFNVFLFAEPDINSERLGFASEGELVEVLGRSGTDWFYARTAIDTEGFVPNTYLDWRGDFNSLIEQD
jgi:hypothetical protein